MSNELIIDLSSMSYEDIELKISELDGKIISVDNPDSSNIAMEYYMELMKKDPETKTDCSANVFFDLADITFQSSVEIMHEMAGMMAELECKKCSKNFISGDECEQCLESMIESGLSDLDYQFFGYSDIHAVLASEILNTKNYLVFDQESIYEYHFAFDNDATDIIYQLNRDSGSETERYLTVNHSQQLLLPGLVRNECVNYGGEEYIYADVEVNERLYLGGS